MLLSLAISIGLATLDRPLLLVHVMPWFQAEANELGWHWRMNRSTQEVRKSGKIASHYQPLIGPYDSDDPHVVELQVLWMKVAGFDGILADWYGYFDVHDYAAIHRRTERLFASAEKVGLKFGVVLEDQSVAQAVSTGKLQESDVATTAKELGAFLKGKWMRSRSWIRLAGKPAVIVFGPQKLGEEDWRAFRAGAGDIQLITLHNRKPYADGGFDWPIPGQGVAFTNRFVERSKGWPIRIPVAYPRFHDYYREGGQTGYPVLPDRDGATYRETLQTAISAGGQAVQVATWNDWQEGTQIEPSREFMFRDLEATQSARRRLDPGFRFAPRDLDLPLRLFRLRQGRKVNPAELDAVASALSDGETQAAKAQLEKSEK